MYVNLHEQAAQVHHKSIQIWDIAEKRIHRVLRGHSKAIHSLAYSPDGRRLVSCSWDCTARVWDMESGDAKVLTKPGEVSSANGFSCVAVVPGDGSLVAASCIDDKVYIWDANTGALLKTLEGHEDSVYGVAFTPDGRSLVSVSLDQTVKIWDLGAIGVTDSGHVGRQTRTLKGHKVGRLLYSTFNPTSTLLCRTSFSAPLYLKMVGGLYQVRKIATCVSGTQKRDGNSFR